MGHVPLVKVKGNIKQNLNQIHDWGLLKVRSFLCNLWDYCLLTDFCILMVLTYTLKQSITTGIVNRSRTRTTNIAQTKCMQFNRSLLALSVKILAC
jgi:hypothetical protein